MWIAFKYGTNGEDSRFLGVFTDRASATSHLCDQFPQSPYKVRVYHQGLTDLSVGHDIVGQVYTVDVNEKLDISV